MEQLELKKAQPAGKQDSDYTLLVRRIKKSPFDENGRAFVKECAANIKMREHLGDDELNSVALICQQHGLITWSLNILEWLNEHRPEYLPAWKFHLETLQMLGRNEDIVRVNAMAARSLPADRIGSWAMVHDKAETSLNQSQNEVAEPFLNMRRDEENVRIFMRLFRGREDAFARQWSDKNREKQGYVPVRHELMPSDINDHLRGSKTYGIYLLNDESQVYTGVIDVDLIKPLRQAKKYKENAGNIRRESIYLHRRILELSREHKLTSIAEVSGGKGYHFWFPMAEPVDAAIMRKALLQLTAGLAGDVKCFQLEIFPKQDRISGKGFGNLVKLPMGIHRGSGKPSWFIRATDRERQSQFEYLRSITPSEPDALKKLAGTHKKAKMIVHPRHAKWAGEYPELATLSACCSMLGQIIALVRTGKTLSVREEKILLGTLAHLPRGRHLLHHLFSELPEYNRPLLDYRISKIRGTVLGCKRIHSLLEQHTSDLPCSFAIHGREYAHPLLHIENFKGMEPKSEKVENLIDALLCLQTAMKQVERFI